MEELGIALITALNSMAFVPAEATLLFAGDAMMHQQQIDAARQSDGSYSFGGYFDHIAPLIREADYSVVNLETPTAHGFYSGYPMFNAPDSYVDELKNAGFDMMLTANNHTLDRRDRGLVRTVDLIESRGLDHIGTYRSEAARDSVIPFIKDINGFRIGFLNYTYGTNGIDIQGKVVVDYIDRDKMARDIEKTQAAGAELICVAVHWGLEYKLLPNAHQKSLADFLFSKGADMVIGGHPHVIQPMEMRTDKNGRNRFLVYSLGNFISNMKTQDTRGGAIARVHLSRDGSGKAVISSADYDLVFTMPGEAGGDNFHLVYADSCADTRWSGRAKAFSSSAKNIFDKHNINVNQRQSR